ncbi:PAM68-like protein [Senna tora]|uniref:PAM68-like protein n=1 Tax=Senna tora TaxID=362788 RepID=A0A834WXA8_9FABA|nr:PAM68-like protein [Senna tora]
METLICASNPSSLLHLSKLPPLKSKTPAFHSPKQKLKKPHANAKGFSSSTPSSRDIGNEITTSTKNPNKKKKNKDEDDDEIPQQVFNRMIVRILVSVGVPMGLGLAFLHVFGVLKEQHVWNAPLWVPFVTTFMTFGASALGIAYGTLSTSLDLEREGSFLGVEEVQRNWVEMWKEEDENESERMRMTHSYVTQPLFGFEMYFKPKLHI